MPLYDETMTREKLQKRIERLERWVSEPDEVEIPNFNIPTEAKRLIREQIVVLRKILAKMEEEK